MSINVPYVSPSAEGVVSVDVGLDELAERIRSRRDNLFERIRDTSRHVIAIGNDLIAAKKKCGHGKFLAWIEKEFGWSANTARNYMKAARWAKSKSTTVVDLPVTDLYKLASAERNPANSRLTVLEKEKKWHRDLLSYAQKSAKAAEDAARVGCREKDFKITSAEVEAAREAASAWNKTADSLEKRLHQQ